MSMYPAHQVPGPQWGSAPQTPQWLMAVGDIQVTSTHVVTPSGTFALRDVNVYAMDQTYTSSKTPTWAIVAAVVTVWFALLGLLFLLAKEQKTEGYVTITIDGGGMRHVSSIPVFTPQQRAAVLQNAAYLSMLAGQARMSA